MNQKPSNKCSPREKCPICMNRFVNVKILYNYSLVLITATTNSVSHVLIVGLRYLIHRFRKETAVPTADKPFNSFIRKRFFRKIQNSIKKAESNNDQILPFSNSL